MSIWRSLLFAVVFYANTAIFLVFGSPLLLGPRRWAMAGLNAHARASLWWLKVIVGTSLEVRGRERLPAGPVLVATKHQSAWDTFALVPVFADPALVLKAELLAIPFYGWFCRKFKHIAVKRGGGAAALRRMVRDAKTEAARGRQIVIFPEGTRRTPGAPPDYKPGVLTLYENLGLPCVPVALNSGVFWPRRSLRRWPGTVVVEILDPIPAGLERPAFRTLLEERLEGACRQLLAEARGSGQN
ncbi:MAG: lysophospholipid acyltransferase family protein [Hyphomicrobiaceae bacterium]